MTSPQQVAGCDVVVGDVIELSRSRDVDRKASVVGVGEVGAFVRLDTDRGESELVPRNRSVIVWR
jgi:hypothetical protein